MAVKVPARAPVALEGVVTSAIKRGTANGTMTITSIAVATGDTYDCIWWNAVSTPPVGSRVAVRGSGSKTGDVSVSSYVLVDQPDQPPEHRLLDYYRACLEAETQSDGPVPLSSRNLLVLDRATSPFGATAIELSDDAATTRWAVAREVSGRAESVSLCWPIEVVTSAGARSVIPILRMDVEIRGGMLSPRPGTLQIDEDFLQHRGLGEAETQMLHELANQLPSRDAAAHAEALLELLGVQGLVNTRVVPPRADNLTAVEGLAFNAVAIARSTAYSSIIRRLAGEIDQLKMRPLHELRTGPLGVLLGKAAPQPYPLPYATPSVVEANLDQERAIAASTSCVLTVVTGPPGTGKSQVLTNAVAAAIERGESVLLASKNNHAIDVVTQRVDAIHPNCHVVRLGKRDLLEKAAAKLADHMRKPPGGGGVSAASTAWTHEVSRVAHVYEALAERKKLADEIAQREAELARDEALLPAGVTPIADKTELDLLSTAVNRLHRSLAEWEALPRRWFWQKRRARAAERVATEHAAVAVNLTSPSLVPVLSAILQNDGPSAAANVLRQVVTLAERASELIDLRQRYSLMPSVDSIDAQISNSFADRLGPARAMLGARLDERLNEPTNRARASAYLAKLQAAATSGDGAVAYAARDVAPTALAALPVWAVTSLAVGSAVPLQQGLFDLVVIDEASQSDIASAIPLLYRAKRAMIVGDANQLNHITSIGSDRSEALAEFFAVDQSHRRSLGYRSTSLYDAAVTASNEEPILLRHHYRSHPHIAEFASITFYGGALIVDTPLDRLLPGSAVRWDDVRGIARIGPSGRSVVNDREAHRALEVLVEHLDEISNAGASIGIVSPFRAQVDCIVNLLAREMPNLAGAVTIDTAHGFQGDERDIMIFSPVVSSDFPSKLLAFAGNRNLVNVSLTRARSRLVVVGDGEACVASGTVLADLARYIAAVG
jgi:chorismate mutase